MMILGLHPFLEAMSVVGAVAIGIVSVVISLALFFHVLSWFTDRGDIGLMQIKGVLTAETWTTVHASGGRKFERVRLVGYTDSDTSKNRLPYELNRLVILEDENKQRFLLRPKDIQYIVVGADEKAV